MQKCYVCRRQWESLRWKFANLRVQEIARLNPRYSRIIFASQKSIFFRSLVMTLRAMGLDVHNFTARHMFSVALQQSPAAESETFIIFSLTLKVATISAGMCCALSSCRIDTVISVMKTVDYGYSIIGCLKRLSSASPIQSQMSHIDESVHFQWQVFLTVLGTTLILYNDQRLQGLFPHGHVAIFRQTSLHKMVHSSMERPVHGHDFRMTTPIPAYISWICSVADKNTYIGPHEVHGLDPQQVEHFET